MSEPVRDRERGSQSDGQSVAPTVLQLTDEQREAVGRVLFDSWWSGIGTKLLDAPTAEESWRTDLTDDWREGWRKEGEAAVLAVLSDLLAQARREGAEEALRIAQEHYARQAIEAAMRQAPVASAQFSMLADAFRARREEAGRG
jgi:hypothetical protein